MVADVTGILDQLGQDGGNALFEGAQGAMLDVDLGTYPYVTSSTTTAGGAAAGTGLGPRRLHEVADPHIAGSPDSVALIDDSVRWTYRELDQHVRAIADELTAPSIRAGDRKFCRPVQ